ncbi:MAG: flavodoxin domain-containing protein, partial [Oscillospiraceae bacterium]|nr:flavodoxin domain-containing protein [Oscillospiraceae bacterium]
MKTVICYYSRHHGNTRKVLEAMAEAGEVDLIDVTTRQAVGLEAYDCVGFASGVYFGKFHEGVLAFARQYLPQGKPVFFVYTYGGAKGAGTK